MSQRVRERDDENYPYRVLHYWRHFITMMWNGEKNIENTCQKNTFLTKSEMKNISQRYIFYFQHKVIFIKIILINKFSIRVIVDKLIISITENICASFRCHLAQLLIWKILKLNENIVYNKFINPIYTPMWFDITFIDGEIINRNYILYVTLRRFYQYIMQKILSIYNSENSSNLYETIIFTHIYIGIPREFRAFK